MEMNEQEKRRLTDDLQGLFDSADEMYYLYEIGDNDSLGPMLAFQIEHLRDLADRLDIEIVEYEDESEEDDEVE